MATRRERPGRPRAERCWRRETRLSFSAGVCRVDVDCMLTDREVLAKANLAKNFVKAREKARIAAYRGPLFREEDLTLV